MQTVNNKSHRKIRFENSSVLKCCDSIGIGTFDEREKERYLYLVP